MLGPRGKSSVALYAPEASALSSGNSVISVTTPNSWFCNTKSNLNLEAQLGRDYRLCQNTLISVTSPFTYLV